jgi:hypothetical protein
MIPVVGKNCMSRNLFWLSDEQWVRIEPHCRRMCVVSSAPMFVYVAFRMEDDRWRLRRPLRARTRGSEHRRRQLGSHRRPCRAAAAREVAAAQPVKPTAPRGIPQRRRKCSEKNRRDSVLVGNLKVSFWLDTREVEFGRLRGSVRCIRKASFTLLNSCAVSALPLQRRNWNTGLPRPKNGRGSANVETVLRV